MRRVFSLAVVLALALIPRPAAAEDLSLPSDGPSALMGLDWECLAGGAGNGTMMRESGTDPTAAPPGRTWSGEQYSGALVLRFTGWGRRFGVEAGASAEHGQARFSGLICWRLPVSGVEPYAGFGLHYISAFAADSLRSRGILTEEFDVAAALGARFYLDRRPFLFVDCRYLGGGNFVNDWPQDTWHKQHTIQFAGGFGITL